MNRIRELRAECNMYQSELARRLRVSEGTISKYENENSNLTADTLRELSSIFGVSVDYIIGLSDARTPGTSVTPPRILTENRVLFEMLDSLSPRSKKKALEYLEMLKVMEENRATDRQNP